MGPMFTRGGGLEGGGGMDLRNGWLPTFLGAPMLGMFKNFGGISFFWRLCLKEKKL